MNSSEISEVIWIFLKSLELSSTLLEFYWNFWFEFHWSHLKSFEFSWSQWILLKFLKLIHLKSFKLSWSLVDPTQISVWKSLEVTGILSKSPEVTWSYWNSLILLKSVNAISEVNSLEVTWILLKLLELIWSLVDPTQISLWKSLEVTGILSKSPEVTWSYLNCFDFS